METASPTEGELAAYRELAFLRLDFSATQAKTLADSRVDVHEAADLIGQACPPDIAFDILRDVEFTLPAL